MSMYTPQKVYRLLAPLLPAGTPTWMNLARFSEEGNWPGLAKHIAAVFEIYSPGSPELQTRRSWPEEVWNPAHAELGARYGVRWLRLSDLHHLAEGEDPLICVVLVGDQLLVGATLSTTKRHIAREDGEDENAFLVLLMALMNHYRSLRALRFAEDVTRAARDDFGWSATKRKCKDRDIRIVLAGRSYDMKDQGERSTDGDGWSGTRRRTARGSGGAAFGMSGPVPDGPGCALAASKRRSREASKSPVRGAEGGMVANSARRGP
jgi:hypothetical protein